MVVSKGDNGQYWPIYMSYIYIIHIELITNSEQTTMIRFENFERSHIVAAANHWCSLGCGRSAPAWSPDHASLFFGSGLLEKKHRSHFKCPVTKSAPHSTTLTLISLMETSHDVVWSASWIIISCFRWAASSCCSAWMRNLHWPTWFV